MKSRALCLAGAAAVMVLEGCEPSGGSFAKPTAHETRVADGWTVHVDTRLLSEEVAEDAELGRRAMELLREELVMIDGLSPGDIPKKLRTIPIWLDLSHGELKGEMYHPGKEWLIENGYSTELWRCVQIPRAADFVDPGLRVKEPVPVLHQLIHAFHDRAFGLEDAQIEEAFERYKASGNGARVRLPGGEMGPHPALVSSREYFMEMSLAYAGAGRCVPKTREELRALEPATFDLIRESWERGQPSCSCVKARSNSSGRVSGYRQGLAPGRKRTLHP